MFDIGFAELVLVGVVGLLVIGPERLPSAIRTGSVWLNRLRRGFNDIKREVQQELHNDEIMQDLRRTGQQIKAQADDLARDLDAGNALPAPPDPTPAAPAPTESGTGQTGGTVAPSGDKTSHD
jgi:sec-independent protein translocase protein TatB